MILELQLLIDSRRPLSGMINGGVLEHVRSHLLQRDRLTPSGPKPKYEETSHYRLHRGGLPAPFLSYISPGPAAVYWMAISPQPKAGATFLVIVDMKQAVVTGEAVLLLIETLESLLPSRVILADITIRVGQHVECRVEQHWERPPSPDLKAGLLLSGGLLIPIVAWPALSIWFRDVLLLGLLINALYTVLLTSLLWIMSKPRIRRKVVFYRGK